MRDKVARDRCNQSKGDANPNTKVSDTQIEEIRYLYTEGFSGIELAKMYNVSVSYTYDVLKHARR